MKRAIKTLALMLLFAAPALFVACGDKNEGEDSLIVGTWQYVSYIENGSTYDANGTWTFTADGKLNVNIGGSPSSGTYTLDGDKLTWDFGWGPQVFKVLTLTKTDLSVNGGDRNITYNMKR